MSDTAEQPSFSLPNAQEGQPAQNPRNSIAKAGGRPTKYQRTMCKLVKRLGALGASEWEIAAELGISTMTLRRWRSDRPEFNRSFVLGMKAADERVKESFYHRAIGYNYDAVKIMQHAGKELVVPYTEHVPPDVTAAFQWLKNRKPLEWRDKVEHEVTGNPVIFSSPILPAHILNPASVVAEQTAKPIEDKQGE